MARIIHFEIQADDPERAMNFYEKTFDWKFNKWEGPLTYWLVTTGPENEAGIDGGLMKRAFGTGGDAVGSFICTIGVSSVDEYLTKVTENGGTITHPKHPIPGVGWAAYCKDTEGNLFGIFAGDASAH